MSYKNTTKTNIKGIPILREDGSIVISFEDEGEVITLSEIMEPYLETEVRIAITLDKEML